VLDVVEELDPERRHPPETIDFAREAAAQRPEPDEHDHRVAVVHAFRLDEPWEEHPEGATRLGDRPPST
jgi:hypothetical protein